MQTCKIKNFAKTIYLKKKHFTSELTARLSVNLFEGNLYFLKEKFWILFGMPRTPKYILR